MGFSIKLTFDYFFGVKRIVVLKNVTGSSKTGFSGVRMVASGLWLHIFCQYLVLELLKIFVFVFHWTHGHIDEKLILIELLIVFLRLWKCRLSQLGQEGS